MHKAHQRIRGFSLTEVVIVFALVAIIGSSALLLSMDSLRAYQFRSDRNVLISALWRARAQSIHNVCLGSGTCTDGKPHGVAVVAGNYVLFQGKTYATRDSAVDHVLDGSKAVTRAGLSEVVFTQLSATSTSGSITLTDATGRSSVISINTEGGISWTN